MKKILFLFFISLFTRQLQGQAVKFDKLIDVQEDLWLEDAVETANGDFIIVGTSNLTGFTDQTQSHPVFIKLDANGNLLHFDTSPVNGTLEVICITSDNNYIAGGSKYDSSGDRQMWLYKFDDNFQMLKDSSWGNINYKEDITKINRGHNQDLILSVSFTGNTAPGSYSDIYYAAIKEDFTIIKENYITLFGSQYPSNVIQNADGEGYYTSIHSYLLTTSQGYYCNGIVKLDKELNIAAYPAFDTVRNSSGQCIFEYRTPVYMDNVSNQLLLGGIVPLYKTSSCSMGNPNGNGWKCDQLKLGLYDTLGNVKNEHFLGDLIPQNLKHYKV